MGIEISIDISPLLAVVQLEWKCVEIYQLLLWNEMLKGFFFVVFGHLFTW